MNPIPTYRTFDPKVMVTSLALAVCLPGCGSDSKDGSKSGVTDGGGVIALPDADTGTNGGAANFSGVWPPPGYINVTNVSSGAYALGPELTAGGGGSGAGGAAATTTCAGLHGVVRDFKMGDRAGGHPDFETAPDADDKGIVTNALGGDGKPVYAHPGGRTSSTTGQAAFDQWYNDTAGVNRTYLLGLHLVQNGTTLTFSASINNPGGQPDSSFFPLDGQGWGNEGQPHNFAFTTEIHTSFTYNAGDTFTFVGDDDVWVFINGQLAIDLGGRHAQETGSVSLDAQSARLGITVGGVYDLAVFHAERHTVQSNFRIDTTLAFTNCGVVNGVVY